MQFNIIQCQLHIARITESLSLKGISADHKVQLPCPKSFTQNRLPTTTSRQFLSMSKDGDLATFLGDLCQCSVSFTGKKRFLMFKHNLLCFHLYPLSLSLVIGHHWKGLDSILFCMLPSGIHTLQWSPPWAFSLDYNPSFFSISSQ